MAAVAELKAAFQGAIEKLEKARLKWITQTSCDNTDEEESEFEATDDDQNEMNDYVGSKTSASEEIRSVDQTVDLEEYSNNDEELELKPVWYIPNIFNLRPILGFSSNDVACLTTSGPLVYARDQKSAGSRFYGRTGADKPQQNTTTLKPLKVEEGQYSPYFNMYYGSDGLMYGYATKFAVVEGSTDNSTESIGLVARDSARPKLVAKKPEAALLAERVEKVTDELQQVSLDQYIETDPGEYYECVEDERQDEDAGEELTITGGSVNEDKCQYDETDVGENTTFVDAGYDEYAERGYEYETEAGYEADADLVQEEGTYAGYDECLCQDLDQEQDQGQDVGYQEKMYETDCKGEPENQAGPSYYEVLSQYGAITPGHRQSYDTGYAYYKNNQEQQPPDLGCNGYHTAMYLTETYINPCVYGPMYGPSNGYY